MSYPEWGELQTASREKANLLIKAIPFDGAASAGKGAREAPDRIRQLSKVLPPSTGSGIIMKDFYIRDEGDFDTDLDWQRYWETIRQGAGEMLRTGKFCFFLGGDHSVSIPTEAAFLDVYQGSKVGIIHFDSHSDILDDYEGHQWSHACTQRRALEHPSMNPAGLSLFGIRSWEEAERDFLARHPEITVVTAESVWEGGIKPAVQILLDKYRGYDALYFTIDIDVLDPAFAPGTGTPESGGLSSRELLWAVKTIVSALPVKAMDIVEVSPPRDHSDITSWGALKIMYEVFGQVFLKEKAATR